MSTQVDTKNIIIDELSKYYNHGLWQIIREDKWDWEYLSSHKKFNYNWLKAYPRANWDWEQLSKRYDFSFEWVEKFPDKAWDWSFLSYGNDFSFEWVEKFPDKDWDFMNMRVSSYYDSIEEKCRREYMAVYKIQQWWFRITLSPEYKIGRKFINKKYDECFA